MHSIPKFATKAICIAFLLITLFNRAYAQDGNIHFFASGDKHVAAQDCNEEKPNSFASFVPILIFRIGTTSSCAMKRPGRRF